MNSKLFTLYNGCNKLGCCTGGKRQKTRRISGCGKIGKSKLIYSAGKPLCFLVSVYIYNTILLHPPPQVEYGSSILHPSMAQYFTLSLPLNITDSTHYLHSLKYDKKASDVIDFNKESISSMTCRPLLKITLEQKYH